MSIKLSTPCDIGLCPYDVEHGGECEWYCSEEEPQDDPEIWEEEDYYLDLSVEFYDGECAHVRVDFPGMASDFEIDVVLRRALPKYTYDQFMRGEINISGIGEDGYLTHKEIHKQLFELVDGYRVVLELGVTEP